MKKFIYGYRSLKFEVGKGGKKVVERGKKKKKEIDSHLAGLEPATFRLTAERANRLRHKCCLKKYIGNVLFIASLAGAPYYFAFFFQAPLSGASTEPVLVELIPGGSKVPVTPERVQEYVRYTCPRLLFIIAVSFTMDY